MRASVSSGVTLGASATGTFNARARSIMASRSWRMSTSPPVAIKTGRGIPKPARLSTNRAA